MITLTQEIERKIQTIKVNRHIKVAVMGCAVNGPGEARDADVGVACGDGKALLFKRGAGQYPIPESAIVDTLYKEIISII
jgi:(E)-4-hydroxy-3-methylbut-2-enyl-diphosphate synthase